MVNQICVAGVVEGACRGSCVRVRAGLDAKQVVEVISKARRVVGRSERSWQHDVDGKFDFGFAVDSHAKDLRSSWKKRARTAPQLPSTALIDQFYAKLQKQGPGRLDTSSLMRLLVDVHVSRSSALPAATVTLVRDTQGGLEVLMSSATTSPVSCRACFFSRRCARSRRPRPPWGRACCGLDDARARRSASKGTVLRTGRRRSANRSRKRACCSRTMKGAL